LAQVISAQKAEDGKITWVEFTPSFHSHLVKCTVVLVPHPITRVKRVMFVFVLELLNQEGHLAFFELQKGGHKANNAQKEKQRLAWKQSRAAKQEWECEAAKAAQLPPPEAGVPGMQMKVQVMQDCEVAQMWQRFQSGLQEGDGCTDGWFTLSKKESHAKVTKNCMKS